MWPFSKKPSPSQDTTLVFKGNEEFFRYQCQFGQTTIREKSAVIGIVLNGTDYGLDEPVKRLGNGYQQALIKVASVDGGFVVATMTPTDKGDRLKPDDIVLWVPVEHRDAGNTPPALFKRNGWIGYIVAKVKPEIDLKRTDFDIICHYELAQENSPEVRGDEELDEVRSYASHLGIDVTPYGIGVALLSLGSGYSAAETAIHFAVATLARDFREAGSDIEKRASMMPRVMATLECLKELLEKGHISKEVWEAESRAVGKISFPSPDTKKWINDILSDPVVGKERVATSRV